MLVSLESIIPERELGRSGMPQDDKTPKRFCAHLEGSQMLVHLVQAFANLFLHIQNVNTLACKTVLVTD